MSNTGIVENTIFVSSSWKNGHKDPRLNVKNAKMDNKIIKPEKKMEGKVFHSQQ